MDGRQSAFAALGLRPDADRAQVEEAYRRLIKLYHPDRPGGNGERAAQINRAYRELRNSSETLPVRMQPNFAAVRPRRRARWSWTLVACAVIAAGLFFGRDATHFERARPEFGFAPAAAAKDESGTRLAAQIDDFEEPLSKSAIDRSAADALRLYRNGNAASLAGYSRSCEAQFRDHPDVVWFDSCAAYDEAIVLLQSRDPMSDSGPFNPAAVTAREMGAAGLLTDDSLTADSRLHKIRARVELVLLSNLPQ